jgi:hypothetical protein
VPPVAQSIKLPDIFIPQDLYLALQKTWLPDHFFTLPGKCNNYVKCIKSLFNLKKIESQNYLAILKICLYLEQYELDLELERQGLVNHDIKKAKDLSECFIITMSSLNSDNSLIMSDDKVILHEAVTKRTIPATIVQVAGNEVTIQLCNPQ